MVGRGHGKDDTCWTRDVLEEHIPDLLLNIAWLVSDWHFRQTRKIDESERQDIGGEDAEVDGEWGDASVFARLRLGIANNLVTNLAEVVEFLAGEVEELAPFVGVRGLVRAVVYTVRLCEKLVSGKIVQRATHPCSSQRVD